MNDAKIAKILKEAKLSKECLKHLKTKFEKIEEELKTQALNASGENELREIQAMHRAAKRLEKLLEMDLIKAKGVKNG